MTTIHVLTAVTRPANLPQLATSIRRAAIRADCAVVWHWRFDPECRYIGGQVLKNEMLAEVPEDAWVYILDDDTVVHRDLFALVPGFEGEAIVVTQIRPNEGWLHAAPHNVTVGLIDIGQVIFRKSIVEGNLIGDAYTGDGEFLHKILAGRMVRFVDEPLCHYNKLRKD